MFARLCWIQSEHVKLSAALQAGGGASEAYLCAVGSAVGVLLQLGLLQLLFVHQGQLLLMLLVLFSCER